MRNWEIGKLGNWEIGNVHGPQASKHLQRLFARDLYPRCFSRVPQAIMSIKFRLCIDDYPVPLEEVEAETLGGLTKGHLLSLTQRGNYKWLEKAFEQSDQKQKHRFYRGGGAKFKVLQEMQEAIRLKRKDDKKIPFVVAEIRGHQVVLQNKSKGVRLLLPQDHAVEELTWFINCVTKDLEDAGDADPNGDPQDDPQEAMSGDDPGEPPEQSAVEDIIKSASSTIINAAQEHSRCFSISWRPSRMAFLVKRSLENDKKTHEFCIKEPKKARKEIDKGPQEHAGQALQDVFDACLQDIMTWLDETPPAPPSENIMDEQPQDAA